MKHILFSHLVTKYYTRFTDLQGEAAFHCKLHSLKEDPWGEYTVECERGEGGVLR
jgi:hypothetical protein